MKFTLRFQFIQKARQSDAKAPIRKSVDNATQSKWGGRFHLKNSPEEMNRMVIALQERVEVIWSIELCYEALTDLNAYYKVSIFNIEIEPLLSR
jgi:hypothetical protein